MRPLHVQRDFAGPAGIGSRESAAAGLKARIPVPAQAHLFADTNSLDFRDSGEQIAQLVAIEARSPFNYNRSLTRLCANYGVHPGGHDALEDARAAVGVFLEQVVRNNAGQRPLDLEPSGDPTVVAD